jgi:hypothetical protein
MKRARKLVVTVDATMSCRPRASSPVESCRLVWVWRVRSSVPTLVAGIVAVACGASGVTLI